MYLNVDLDQQSVELMEAHDCREFSVLVSGDTSPEGVDRVLQVEEIGSVDPDGEHAWVALDALRAMAMGQVTETWQADFADMVGYAASKGWLDADGASLRGHLRWADV